MNSNKFEMSQLLIADDTAPVADCKERRVDWRSLVKYVKGNREWTHVKLNLCSA